MVMPSGGEGDRIEVGVDLVLNEAELTRDVERIKGLLRQMAQELGVTLQQAAGLYKSYLSSLGGLSPDVARDFAQAIKELGITSTQSFNAAGIAAQAYRTRIDGLRSAIRELSAEKGISLEDAAKGLSQTTFLDDRALVSDALKEEQEMRRTQMQERKAESAQAAKSLVAEEKAMATELKTIHAATAAEQKAAIREHEADMKNTINFQMAEEKALAAKKKAAYDEDIIQIKRVKEQILELARTRKITPQAAAELPEIKDNFNTAQVTAGLHDATNGAEKFKAGLLGTANVAKYIFGTVMGISVAQVLQTLVQFFQSATVAATEFSAALFKLEVGVRALERQGVNISLSSISKQISDLQKQFPQFTTKQLVEGFGQATLSARELGLSSEDLNKFVQSSTILSQITGNDIGEVMRTFALAMSSGYSEGLQKMYLNINRATIAQRGLEMGFKGGYNAMTQQQRAAATLAIVYEQSGKLAGDAAKYQETYSGKLATASALWEQAKQSLGEQFLPILASAAVFFAQWFGWITKIWLEINTLSKKIAEIPAGILLAFLADATILADTLWKVLSGKGFNLEEFKQKFVDVNRFVKSELDKNWGITKTGSLGDVAPGERGTQPLVTETDAQVAAEDKAMSEMKTIIEDGGKARLDAEEAYKRSLEQLEIEYNRSIEDEAIAHQRKLDDIALDYTRKRAEAQADYARQVQQDAQDAADKINELNEKKRQDDLEAERDYRNKLLSMQEDYLLGMEDAIRGNDIKGAAQLTRQYNLQRKQAERDFGASQQGRQETYQQELARLQKSNQDKRAEAARAFAQKMSDLAQQEAYARADEQRRHVQELADLRVQYDQKRADKLKDYQRDQADLEKSLNDRLKALAQAIVAENNLSMDGANKIYQNLLQYYGPNGAILKLYQYMGQAVQNAANAATSTSADNLGIAGGAADYGKRAYARGGTFIASTPTTALFGEAGPELVSITPLTGKSGSDVQRMVSTSFPNNVSGGASVNNGKISIRVGLSQGLVGEIIEQSLDQFTEVLVRSER